MSKYDFVCSKIREELSDYQITDLSLEDNIMMHTLVLSFYLNGCSYSLHIYSDNLELGEYGCDLDSDIWEMALGLIPAVKHLAK